MLIIRRRHNNTWNCKSRYKITISKSLTLMKHIISTRGSGTDSSLDTSSIEVIQPIEGLEIRLQINPPQRAPPNSPESPRTNVAVTVPDDLLTEDEETEDQHVPLTERPVALDIKGRQETLSPTPQVPQTVRSAIELTVKDFEPSEQCIIDKCSEVDFQLSNH